MTRKQHENRLIHETSPYLLQHARNPVDWYPWGKEALDKARTEGKPIFVSIGYSTCHWCHVMERESFEDEATAAIMNEHFVSIKVDREERPDIDAAYMGFVVATTGSGGWPLNVFCTPSGKPFFGGTYFPPKPRHGMISFKELLRSIAAKHATERDTIDAAAGRIAVALQESLGARHAVLAAGEPGPGPVTAYNEQFLHSFDPVHGGSHGAPKFPITLEILYNFYQKQNIAESLFTLRKMALGGIHDHVGGGFHRYSVDDHWLVPHFEKMLYDNALLLEAFSKAFLLSGDMLYKDTASGIFTCLRDELLGDHGFYAAQDADSEGVEGKFYVFTRDEIEQVVADPATFCKVYNVTRHGNFEGKTILHVNEDAFNELDAAGRDRVRSDLARLKAHRRARVAPGTDTKIITAWNGLALSALAWHFMACGDDEALAVATRVAKHFIQSMVDDGHHVTRIAGKEAIHGFLDDHAALANAFLDLHDATFDASFLEAARELVRRAIDEFHDGDGRFTESGTRNEVLFARETRVHDAVVPSGASLVLLAMLKLDAVDPDEGRRALLERSLRVYTPSMEARPLSMAMMVMVLHGALGAHVSVSIPRDLAANELLTSIRRLPAFNKSLHVAGDMARITACTRDRCTELDDATPLERVLRGALD